METLHKSFENKTGNKLKTGSITSTSLGDSFLVNYSHEKDGTAGSGAQDKGKDKESHGEIREEKSMDSLTTTGPLPPINLPPPPGSAGIKTGSRRFALTSGKHLLLVNLDIPF